MATGIMTQPYAVVRSDNGRRDWQAASMSLRLRAAVVSDLGLIRSNNEDAAHAGPRLLAVADGIGGAPAGELASDIVIRTLAPLDEAPDTGDPLEDLRAALDDANRQIGAAADADPSRQGMGTTLTALLATGDRLALLHVGDSRGYRLRAGVLSRLTRDDTFVQELVDRGVLRPEDVRHHPQRSIITQAVQGADFTATATVLTPRTGDRYLLCSDGLSDYVTDEAIEEELITCPEPQACAERLIGLALQAGAPDNVTVIVSDVLFVETAERGDLSDVVAG
jgi:PPM family protein phosphatase